MFWNRYAAQIFYGSDDIPVKPTDQIIQEKCKALKKPLAWPHTFSVPARLPKTRGVTSCQYLDNESCE